MEIRKVFGVYTICDNKECLKVADNEIDLTSKAGHGDMIYLCDECLKELNRKIVEHLAEKNL